MPVPLFADNHVRSLLEAMPDAIIIADPAGCIVRTKSPAEELFQHPEAELSGQPIEIPLTALPRCSRAAP